MKKIYLLVIGMITLSMSLFSQNVNVSGALVGNGTYLTLGDAFTAINGGAQTGATILVDVIITTTELVTATLNANDWATLTISPNGGGSRTISGNLDAPLVNLNGADNVTVDGLNSGGNFLFIANISTGSSASCVRFINDASNNTIIRTNIQGSSGAALGTGLGLIHFASGTTTGNDNNTVTQCNITTAPGANPLNCIYSLGTSAAIDNSGNTISINNINDFFNSVSSSNGININSFNSGWTINNNAFYQTATRTSTVAGNIPTAIFITSGNGYTINNNIIGGSIPSGGGTPWTFNGAFTNRFVGINVSTIAGATTNIQGNSIANISLSTTSGAAAPTGIFCGISLTGAGSYNVGTVTGNTIGATTGTASIVAVSSSATGAVVGVNLSATGAINFQNNTIGALQATSGTVTIASSVVGVYVGAICPSLNISNNTIGNTTANNMQAGSPSSTTPSCIAAGVNLASTPTNLIFSNNTIQNFISYGTGTAGYVRGFFTTLSATLGTTFTITNNTVRNLSTSTAFSGIGSGVSSVVGIHMLSAAVATISGNTINNLANTNTVATTNVVVSGITLASATLAGAVGTNCFNNRIYDLRNSTVGVTATAPPIVAGIAIRSGNGNTNIYNNMISIGNTQTTNTAFVGIWGNHGSAPNPVTNIYYNSINIEGTAAAGALSSFGYLRGDFTTTARIPTVDVRNNIFNNSRTGGTGSHYAISNHFGVVAPLATGWPAGASNYNVLNSASAATIGHWTTTQTIGGWRTASGGDANALSSVAVNFTNTVTGDLHLNFGVTPTLIESAGQTIAGYATDYDADVRPGPAGSVNGGGILPDIGADETDAVPLDIAPPIIAYTPLTFTCLTGDRIFTSTITDVTGVPISGALQPRVYYRKNAGAWFSSQGTLSGGTNKNGTWSFTIVAADMGGLAVADVVQYYVIAQDEVMPTAFITSNPAAGLVATDVNTVTTPPTTPNIYTIAAILSGTYTVGVAGVYPTLTAAVNAYNNNCLGGAVVFSLIDATYPSETFPIIINANASSSATNTLTIKPTIAGTVISGSTTTSILNINGGDFVTIDGSINNTANTICPASAATRDLTFTQTNVSTAAGVVWLSSASAADGVNNCAVKNCILQGNATTTTIVGLGVGGTVVGSTSLANSNDISFVNNDIRAVQFGIYCGGVSAASKNQNLIVNQNFVNNVAPNAINITGISVVFYNNVSVSGNNVGNIINTLSSDVAGINVGYGVTGGFSTTAVGIVDCNTNVVIANNTVGVISQQGTFSAAGIALGNTASGTSVLANNMISGVSANGTAGDMAGGIFYGGGAGIVNMYHNTVYMQGTITGATAASQISTCLAVPNPAAPTAFNIRNNIFANSQAGNVGATLRQSAIALGYPSPYTGTISNYNDLYAAGPGPGTYTIGVTGVILGTNRVTLADWQTETGGDANSINVLPVFVSASNLHLDSSVNCFLNGKGDYLATVPADFDCDTRDNPNPDMGADEFTSANLVALSGTPGVTTCESKTINPTGTLFVDNVCNRIARVVPSGASPVSGIVNTCIYVEATPIPLPTYNAEPYLPVHYDITPATNPLTSTGTITLYFLQSDFDGYNANNGVWPDLPNAPGDAAGIANLRITQYHGTANTNPSLPNQYSAGTRTYINPADANIVWNVVNNYWEVTFNVAGFSGFYVHTNLLNPLPITFNYLNGVRQGNNHLLNWKVTCTGSPTATLILERSGDNSTFTPVNSVTATALRCQDPFNYTDANPLLGLNYYRVKMIDANGRVSYGNTIALLNAVKGFEVLNVAPNPVTSNGAFKLNVSAAKAETIGVVITDMQGRIIERKQVNIIGGFNAIPMDISKLAAGTYNIQVTSSIGDKSKVLRVVKQ